MSKKRVLQLLGALIILAMIAFVIIDLNSNRFHKTGIWYEDNAYIAHAMGGINNTNYTNSLEAFEASYEAGYRVIEIDFCETSDGVLVGRHSWKANEYDSFTPENIPTAEEFLSTPVHGQYTGVTFEMVLDLAAKYPDVYFVTDTKYEDDENNLRIFTDIINIAAEKGLLDVLKERFIIQVYNEDMYDLITKILAPENILYTLLKLRT